MEGFASSGRTKANVIYTRFKSRNSLPCTLEGREGERERKGGKRDEISMRSDKLSGMEFDGSGKCGESGVTGVDVRKEISKER